MKKQKKIIVLSLCFGLIISGLTPYSLGFAKEAVNGILNKHSDDNHRMMKESVPAFPQTKVLESKKAETTTNANAIQPSQGTTIFGKNQVNLSQADIAAMFQQGYSMEEIRKAEELGNKFHEDPKNLLKEKKAIRKNWADLEKSRMDQLYTVSDSLKEKYPNQLNQLINAGYSTKDQAILLSMLSLKSNVSIDTLIENYKKNGESWALNEIEADSVKRKVSVEKMKKNGLTDLDVEGIDEGTFDKLDSASKKTKRPLKDMLQDIKKLKKQAKEANLKP
jgi:hypothetical protein